jgi:metal-responsive CopG/Arc/MetJ family transcriptional regulator
MKTISLKMPEAFFEKFESTARERGESKSALLRELVQMTVVGKKNGEGSCLDLAKDLAGCVIEDKDLSFNKKRMDGYGK